MKTKMSLLLAAAALLAFTSNSAFALTVPVAHDTYSCKTGKLTWGLTPADGKATSLTVTDSQTALIEFDLSNANVVPPIINPSNIKSVILQLYVVKASVPGDLTMHITSPWSETFAGKSAPMPTISTNVVATIQAAELPPAGTKGFVSADVTAPVVAALESGSNLSIAIQTPTPGANVELGSKDGPAIGYAAVLEIVGAVPGPVNTLTIGTVTSGTAPAVTITGTSPNQTLNFTLEQGPPGPTGELPFNATAIGFNALVADTTGSNNEAFGFEALENNTTGCNNTASGFQALVSNTTGSDDTADGYGALNQNTTGSYNTASGYRALSSNTTGDDNTATGFLALLNNTTGDDNTVSGFNALANNTTGGDNTAIGWEALVSNTNGVNNTASGSEALMHNTSGYDNTASGSVSLFSNTTGANNIAIGFCAGYNLTTGSSNIDIGDFNDNIDGKAISDDVSGESNTIRIGEVSTQTQTFIAGIYNYTASGGVPVYINSNGQLGTVTSSRRFKQNIKSMDDASDTLLSLRPVTFQYKPEIDPKSISQFGLIAEEVEKACPDLVTHDKDGKVYTVRYEAVNAMLLNEFLKEHRRVQDQGHTIAEQQKQIEALTASLAKLTQQIDKVAQRLDGKDYQPVRNSGGPVAPATFSADY